MKWGVTEFTHRNLGHGHYAVGHQMSTRGSDMASHPEFGVFSCGCFGEFRDFVWGCFAVVQTCQSVDGFFNWKRKYRWFDAGICDAEKNSTNKYLDDGPDRLILK